MKFTIQPAGGGQSISRGSAHRPKIPRKPLPKSLRDADTDLASSTNLFSGSDNLNAPGESFKPYVPFDPYTIAPSLKSEAAVQSPKPSELNQAPGGSRPAVKVAEESKSKGKYLCGQCDEHKSDSYYCNLCDTTYCGICWDKVGPHRTKKMGPGGIPHEKTDQAIADMLRATLEAAPSDSEQESLFQNDENTAWFGVVKDENEDSIFYDYGRFADIMGERSRASNSRRRHGSSFPSLVCFVGETGQ